MTTGTGCMRNVSTSPREYKTVRALRQGEIVDVGGIQVKMDEGDIKPGDMYVAERNSGPKFLTALEVDNELGCIFPASNDYPFDIGECVKVCEA